MWPWPGMATGATIKCVSPNSCFPPYGWFFGFGCLLERVSAPHEVPGRQFWSGQAVRLKDGGGIISDADWMVPKGDDCLGALRRVFYASHFILESACAAVGPCCRCQALLNEREVCALQQDMVAFLTSEGFLCSAVVDKGQPLTLSIWDALLKFLGDCLIS